MPELPHHRRGFETVVRRRARQRRPFQAVGALPLLVGRLLAAGDGVVSFAGRQNGYGNVVQLNHGNKYSTRYAHASRIAKGIREGTKVKQGQIIAYVGSTGRSTGPHLHYEILANNIQVNPQGVKFKTGQSLAGKELAAFKKTVSQIEVALDRIPLNKSIAMIDTDKNR